MQLFLLATLVAAAAALYGPPAVQKTAVPDYSYGTAVSDPISGVHNTKEETRLGDRTEGSYSTVLPDGRRQVVTYWVDGDSGYNAKVTYEGVAHHPETAVTTQPQAPVLPQYDPPASLHLNNVLGPPPRDTFIGRPEVPFIPEPLDIPREVSRSIPFVDAPFITDTAGIINGQRALNNFDFVNNQRRFTGSNFGSRADFAADFQYSQAGLGGDFGGGTNFGQHGQVFGGLRGIDVRTPVFEGDRGNNIAGPAIGYGGGAGLGGFGQQDRLGNGGSGRLPPFASVNGFETARPINGFRVRDANNFRKSGFNNLRQNYGYQGY